SSSCGEGRSMRRGIVYPGFPPCRSCSRSYHRSGWSIRSRRSRSRAPPACCSCSSAGPCIGSGRAAVPPRPPQCSLMVIDVHNHFYPPEYLDALQHPESVVRVTFDDAGNPCVHYPGDFNVAVQGHRDISYRAKVLEREGVDTQVLTLTTPGTHVEPPARAVMLAKLVNDAFARIVKERA